MYPGSYLSVSLSLLHVRKHELKISDHFLGLKNVRKLRGRKILSSDHYLFLPFFKKCFFLLIQDPDVSSYPYLSEDEQTSLDDVVRFTLECP